MREDTFFDNSRLPKSTFKTMPFTASHVVAAIPFNKALGKYSALSALIIGSITPDIGYLTPFLVDQRVNTHTLLGIYLFCIPMGLTVYFCYHYLMAPVLTSLLPRKMQMPLNSYLFEGRIPNIPTHVLLLSLIIGALTHNLWDFFTHQSGLAQHWQWLDTPLTSIDGYDIMPYRVLQHLSSVLGLALLIYWIIKWYQKNTVDNTAQHWQASSELKRTALIMITIVTIVGGVLNGLKHLPETDVLFGMYSAQVFVRYAIVGGAAAFLVCCCGLGVIYQMRIRSDASQN